MKQPLSQTNKMNYKTIVNQYLHSFNNTNSSRRTGFALWMDHLRNAKNTWLYSNKTDDLLYLKILCVKGGHQNRMQWTHVVLTIAALDTACLFDFTKTYKDFHDLYNQVSKATSNIPFARGILTRYDISLHIAILLNTPVYPDQVYLANHTRKSAQALKVYQYPYVPLNAFPKAFHVLSCMQLEDVLCVYYKVFLGINNNVKSITNASCIYKIRNKIILINLLNNAVKQMNTITTNKPKFVFDENYL